MICVSPATWSISLGGQPSFKIRAFQSCCRASDSSPDIHRLTAGSGVKKRAHTICRGCFPGARLTGYAYGQTERWVWRER
jgi:hypothetical protein